MCTYVYMYAYEYLYTHTYIIDIENCHNGIPIHQPFRVLNFLTDPSRHLARQSLHALGAQADCSRSA